MNKYVLWYMTHEKLLYIEETGLYFDKVGSTRMVGRIFGYLIVSEKEHNSFEDIRLALQASKGSISGSLRQGENSQLIEAYSLPGDRKTYYKVGLLQVRTLMKARSQSLGVFSDLLSKGGRLKNAQDRTSDQLRELSAFMRWYLLEIDTITRKWEEVKHEFMKEPSS